MEKQNFKILIDAPREKVWNTLWEDATYRVWTAAFTEGSHAETDWKKGSKVLFLDGKNDGMVSVIAENKPAEYMSIEHLGIVKNGKEDTESDKVKEWAGAHENYILKNKDGKTELTVEMDITEEFKSYFETTWPKALDKLKEIAEKNWLPAADCPLPTVSGLKFVIEKSMKKKETLWELLKRLDEEAGQFNVHLYEANRYFDTASTKTKNILKEHEKQLHQTITQVQKAIKKFVKGNGAKEK